MIPIFDISAVADTADAASSSSDSPEVDGIMERSDCSRRTSLDKSPTRRFSIWDSQKRGFSDDLWAHFSTWMPVNLVETEVELKYIDITCMSDLQQVSRCELERRMSDAGRALDSEFLDELVWSASPESSATSNCACRECLEALWRQKLRPRNVRPTPHRLLCDFLWESRPTWSSYELAKAYKKLYRVGVHSIEDLDISLGGQCGRMSETLNQRLRNFDCKVFSTETLIAFRDRLDAHFVRRQSMARTRLDSEDAELEWISTADLDEQDSLRSLMWESCPSWTSYDLQAAETKLANIHIRDARSLARALYAGNLNARLRAAGEKCFFKRTLKNLRRRLGASLQPQHAPTTRSADQLASTMVCISDLQPVSRGDLSSAGQTLDLEIFKEIISSVSAGNATTSRDAYRECFDALLSEKSCSRDARPGPLRALCDLLWESQPTWSSFDLARAYQKLHRVGIHSVEALSVALGSQCADLNGRISGILNERLRDIGFKVFSTETLTALRDQLDAHYFRRQSMASTRLDNEDAELECMSIADSDDQESLHFLLWVSRPSWTRYELRAAENKLANIQIRDVNSLVLALYDDLNARLRAAGEKSFNERAIEDWRIHLRVSEGRRQSLGLGLAVA